MMKKKLWRVLFAYILEIYDFKKLEYLRSTSQMFRKYDNEKENLPEPIFSTVFFEVRITKKRNLVKK